MKLFLTAFLQVFLVSANTVFLSEKSYIQVALCGFFISYIWCGNIRKVSIGTEKDRMLYSSGAMIGGLCGLFLSSLIIK